MSEEKKPSAPPEGADATLLSAQPRVAITDEAEGARFAGRYVLEALAGRGGMGAVYRARDTLVGDVVALKLLELGASPAPEWLERFRREVRLARRITHRHVARTFDLGEHAGRLYLTMEYVEGESLQSLMEREGAVPPARAARLVLALCEGLAAAHAAGVVHRDLKPANVLVEPRGRVVLTDFGIARAVAGEAASRTQGLVGTPMYMAPEQLESGEVDARADLYATGLVLYQLLTGTPPFTGDSPMAVAVARLRHPPPDPRLLAAVPDALAELVLSCLSREPSGRPQDAACVADALRRWLGSVGESLEPEHGHSHGTHPGTRGHAAGDGTSTPRSGGASQVSGAVTPATGTQGSSTPGPSGAGHVSMSSGAMVSRTTPRTPPRAGEQSLAVLPLRFMGTREQEFLGDGVTEALIDVLSRTRGLRVQSSGATERFRHERDPRVAARELGVELVVDGSLQAAGKTVRVTLRVVEGASGTQLWSGRFDDADEDPFQLQDRLGQRLAEALRGELAILAYRATVPAEALALYRQVLSRMSAPSMPRELKDEVITPLEQLHEAVPDFPHAAAHHAVATLRAGFIHALQDDNDVDWAALARTSLERARHVAPELLETKLATAILATREGRWRDAVVALRAALDAAPTFAPALQLLGNLQCEAGRVDEGMPRLKLAYALEPGMAIGLVEVARCSALRGDEATYQWCLERLRSLPLLSMPVLILRMRVSAWKGDLDDVRQCRAALNEDPSHMAFHVANYCTMALGEVSVESAQSILDGLLSRQVDTRFASMLCQLAAELMCLRGAPAEALRYVHQAADVALIDLEWMDRCPVLTPLRAQPGFADARRKVRSRVEAIWSA
ncbi:serine/threonine-protein kinase [Corallococcus macrosporus]|uniref:non-specific serine/threonine protein kinase n=1 Tax=Corallococcus macrosporus DSM 14697 TaxID=1189310 RepID=A0A250K006_9BACT|nr:serine/threonine-protein kinase [Corallococcus macrosporus]ATB49425.1 serine/threonine protein kinase [Corallococcus macrosporus DSM 14697]